MEKEITKNRQATEMTLIKAVNDIIEESGFEGLGINAVAAKAKVSKMLIYRYFNSLDGLIAAYIQQNDYWINFDEELPDQAHLAAFIKQIFKRQIMWLRENYTLKRLYRWELTTDNKFVKELRNKREEKGIWLVEAVSKLSKHPKKEIAAMASIITAAISYLALLEENCPVYNGLKQMAMNGRNDYGNLISDVYNSWDFNPQGSKYPRLGLVTGSDTNGNYSKFSDIFLEDGDYLRLKNITLGYTLPKSVSRFVGMENGSLRVYISVDNVCTITGYSGVDPEVGNYGIDRGVYPVSRFFNFGVNINF